MGVLPQLEIIIIPGACSGVWRDEGSDFNLKKIPNNIFRNKFERTPVNLRERPVISIPVTVTKFETNVRRA